MQTVFFEKNEDVPSRNKILLLKIFSKEAKPLDLYSFLYFSKRNHCLSVPLKQLQATKDVHGIPSSKSVWFWADYGTPAFAEWA